MRLGWLGEVSPAGWDDERMPASFDWTQPEMYVEMVRVLESAGFDFVLFGDQPMSPDAFGGSTDASIEHGVGIPRLDAAVLVAILAVHTDSIGLVPTLTLPFYPPFILARLVRTLDHLADGRAGWHAEPATTDWAANAFGLAAAPDEAERYELADEYLAVIDALLRSWDEDAVVEDPATGLFADPQKVRPIDFAGKYFRVRGPLNVVPSPQYRPPVFHSVDSPASMRFAARYADVVSTRNASPEALHALRDDLRAEATAAGRDPQDITVLLQISPLIGRTADARRALIESLPEQTRVQRGLIRLSAETGIDLAREPLDGPVTPELARRLRGVLPYDRELQNGPVALREVAARVGTAGPYDLSGTAEEIADELETMFDAGLCDGFVLRGRWIPGQVNVVANHVAAELRRRGRLAPFAEKRTLCDRLTGRGSRVAAGSPAK